MYMYMYMYVSFAAILLGTLRMPYKEVRSLVLQVDESLGEQTLGQLLKYLPKKEEVSKITAKRHQ